MTNKGESETIETMMVTRKSVIEQQSKAFLANRRSELVAKLPVHSKVGARIFKPIRSAILNASFVFKKIRMLPRF